MLIRVDDKNFLSNLEELLKVLNEVYFQHKNLHELDEIIEPWTPSPDGPDDEPEQISVPEFTVGSLGYVPALYEALVERKGIVEVVPNPIVMSAKGLLSD